MGFCLGDKDCDHKQHGEKGEKRTGKQMLGWRLANELGRRGHQREDNGGMNIIIKRTSQKKNGIRMHGRCLGKASAHLNVHESYLARASIFNILPPDL